MPVLKHAKKKLRQDKKRTEDNLKVKNTYKKLIKAAKVLQDADSLSSAYQAVDKAVKKNVIHKNKGARLKSQVAAAVIGKVKEVAKVKKAANKTNKNNKSKASSKNKAAKTNKSSKK